jgi:hypothetical protein
MSDNKLYTEAEVRRREREAFEDGAGWYYLDGHKWEGRVAPAARREARKRYPIKRKVPRVVVDGYGIGWKVVGNEVRPEGIGGGSWTITAGRARLWADLVANPYEEVDE